MFFIIVVIIIIVVIHNKKKSTNSTETSYTPSTNSPNTIKSGMQKSSSIKTLSAGEGMFDSADIYDWPDLPSKVCIKSVLTLHDIEQNLLCGLKAKGLNVVSEKARIKYGTASTAHYDDCIIISHANPPESYWDFTFTCRSTDGISFIRIYRSGHSYHNAQINHYNATHRDGRDNVEFVLDFIDNALNKPNLQALEDGYAIENMYYDEVKATIREIFGI